MSPDKFLARLCGFVPPPGFHVTRYFGVFANRHHLRAASSRRPSFRRPNSSSLSASLALTTTTTTTMRQ